MKETEFILYMQHVGSTTSSKSAVTEAVNGVSWVQQLAGYPPVSGTPIVGVTLDGLQRQLAKPKVQKEPVSGDMITESLGSNPTLSDLRLVAACLLAFSAFFAPRRALQAVLL